MIKVILVPVDGTEHSAEVLATALIIAKRFDSHIKVVHVREHVPGTLHVRRYSLKTIAKSSPE